MPPPPTALQWEQYRDLITDHYIRQNKTQKEVAAYMLEEHGFRASEKMFVSRFIKWAINKKMSVEDARAILHAVARRNNARRQVVKLRLRGREVTEQEARTSLKRRKLEITALDHSTPWPSTPSDISVVDEEDQSSIGSMDVEDEQFSGTLANAAVNQRPRSPILVGDERIEVFFINKMRDWGAGCPHESQECIDMFRRYVDALLPMLSLQNPGSSSRALWTIRKLGPIVDQVFRITGDWVMAELTQLAGPLMISAMRHSKVSNKVCLTILGASIRASNGASHHPLAVLCSLLFDANRQKSLDNILRHCSTYSRQRFGVNSWEREVIDMVRSDCMRSKGKFQESLSITESLIEDLNRGTIKHQFEAMAYRCKIAHIFAEAGRSDEAEGILLDVIGRCHQASRDRHFVAVEHEAAVEHAYFSSLWGMMILSWNSNDVDRAEIWARKALLHAERAFGTFDARVISVVHVLAYFLETQEKWMERDALMREWEHVLNPPQLAVEVDDEFEEEDGTDEER